VPPELLGKGSEGSKDGTGDWSVTSEGEGTDGGSAGAEGEGRGSEGEGEGIDDGRGSEGEGIGDGTGSEGEEAGGAAMLWADVAAATVSNAIRQLAGTNLHETHRANLVSLTNWQRC
jgi:hypothetical protein